MPIFSKTLGSFFSTKGRATRTEFILGNFLFWSVLPNLNVSYYHNFFATSPFYFTYIFPVISLLLPVFMVFVYIFLWVFFFMLCTRRLHDIDVDGTWLIWIIVPVVNIILFIWMLLAPGSWGESNRFGRNPRMM